MMFDFPLIYLPEIFFVAGIAFLLVEIIFLSFSTFVLFFLGIGSVFTSLLLFLGFIPLSLDKALFGTSILSACSAMLLWRPMKSLTNGNEGIRVVEGFVNHEFILSDSISKTSPGIYHYSSVDWEVIPQEDIALEAHARVEVVSVEVGKFFVQEVVIKQD